MQYANFKDVPAKIWRWPNFTPYELASDRDNPRDGALIINEHALDMLQRARELAKKPFKINSAYRSLRHNQAVGGSLNSRHLNGCAFDISFKGHDKKELVRVLKASGFTGIGVYSTFCHADSGLERSWVG